jgi:hypothetical protein
MWGSAGQAFERSNLGNIPWSLRLLPLTYMMCRVIGLLEAKRTANYMKTPCYQDSNAIIQIIEFLPDLTLPQLSANWYCSLGINFFSKFQRKVLELLTQIDTTRYFIFLSAEVLTSCFYLCRELYTNPKSLISFLNSNCICRQFAILHKSAISSRSEK